jgi:hypothetical protein
MLETTNIKGQIQPLSAVLVTAVVVTSVSGAYVWGSDILEKQQRETEFSGKQSQITDLYQNSLEVAEAGEGAARRTQLDLDTGSVRINEEQDYIEVTFTAVGQPYPAGSWQLIRGKSSRNLSWSAGAYVQNSQARPGVLAVKPVSSTRETSVRYRVEFRNVMKNTPSGRELTKADIVSSGPKRSGGDTTIILQNTGAEVDSGSNAVEIPTGEEIRRTRTKIQVIVQ